MLKAEPMMMLKRMINNFPLCAISFLNSRNAGAPGILGPLCAHIAVKAVRSGFAGIFFHIHAHANSSSLSCERAIC